MEDNKFNEQITGSRKLLVEDKFRFDCHPGVPCFTRCCKDADMYLYPYDIIPHEEPAWYFIGPVS